MKKKMIVAGIDYSLNGPCICVYQGDGNFDYKQCSFYFLTNVKSLAEVYSYRFYGELFNEFDMSVSGTTQSQTGRWIKF